MTVWTSSRFDWSIATEVGANGASVYLLQRGHQKMYLILLVMSSPGISYADYPKIAIALGVRAMILYVYSKEQTNKQRERLIWNM